MKKLKELCLADEKYYFVPILVYWVVVAVVIFLLMWYR